MLARPIAMAIDEVATGRHLISCEFDVSRSMGADLQRRKLRRDNVKWNVTVVSSGRSSHKFQRLEMFVIWR